MPFYPPNCNLSIIIVNDCTKDLFTGEQNLGANQESSYCQGKRVGQLIHKPADVNNVVVDNSHTYRHT